MAFATSRRHYYLEVKVPYIEECPFYKGIL